MKLTLHTLATLGAGARLWYAYNPSRDDAFGDDPTRRGAVIAYQLVDVRPEHELALITPESLLLAINSGAAFYTTQQEAAAFLASVNRGWVTDTPFLDAPTPEPEALTLF